MAVKAGGVREGVIEGSNSSGGGLGGGGRGGRGHS